MLGESPRLNATLPELPTFQWPRMEDVRKGCGRDHTQLWRNPLPAGFATVPQNLQVRSIHMWPFSNERQLAR